MFQEIFHELVECRGVVYADILKRYGVTETSQARNTRAPFERVYRLLVVRGYRGPKPYPFRIARLDQHHRYAAIGRIHQARAFVGAQLLEVKNKRFLSVT